MRSVPKLPMLALAVGLLALAGCGSSSSSDQLLRLDADKRRKLRDLLNPCFNGGSHQHWTGVEP